MGAKRDMQPLYPGKPRSKDMTIKRRPFPPGVGVQNPMDMEHYLPYRIHLIATKIATPPVMHLSSGMAIRPREWRLLASLGAFGPVTNSEISRVVGMDAATISRA